MAPREAKCACGKLRVTCEGEPLSVALCHCRACQRRTGSSYGIVAFFETHRAKMHGASTRFERSSDSGYPVTFHFCPTCGSTVYWFPARKPGHVGIAVGAFADPDFPRPAKEVHREHRHPWIKLT